MALDAIGEDDERMRANEKIRVFERMRELGYEEKKKRREVFEERKIEEL